MACLFFSQELHQRYSRDCSRLCTQYPLAESRPDNAAGFHRLDLRRCESTFRTYEYDNRPFGRNISCPGRYPRRKSGFLHCFIQRQSAPFPKNQARGRMLDSWHFKYPGKWLWFTNIGDHSPTALLRGLFGELAPPLRFPSFLHLASFGDCRDYFAYPKLGSLLNYKVHLIALQYSLAENYWDRRF